MDKPVPYSHAPAARCRSRDGFHMLAAAISIAFLIPGFAHGQQQGSSQPTLELFPSQAMDSIRETSESARKLENNLQPVINELEEQMKLYQESGCEGSVDDKGCQGINAQMAKTYGRMLDQMAEELPEMKQNIQVSRRTLEKRLRNQLGYGRTGAELQDLLRRARGDGSLGQRTRPSEGGVRLSDRFRQYYRLVSQSGGGTPSALVGARIYLDLAQTDELIGLTEQQIQRGQMLTNLSTSFGQVTPQMQRTISEVKTIMFGQTAAGSTPSGRAPQGPSTQQNDGFCSEFNPNC